MGAYSRVHDYIILTPTSHLLFYHVIFLQELYCASKITSMTWHVVRVFLQLCDKVAHSCDKITGLTSVLYTSS